MAGHYQRDVSREHSRIPNRSIKTVHNQYKNAFDLATSSDNWVEPPCLFGDLGEAARLRPLIEKTRRDIPESNFRKITSRNPQQQWILMLLSKFKQLFSKATKKFRTPSRAPATSSPANCERIAEKHVYELARALIGKDKRLNINLIVEAFNAIISRFQTLLHRCRVR